MCVSTSCESNIHTYVFRDGEKKKKCEREISTRHALIFVYVHTSSIHTRILKDILLFIFNIGTYFNYIVKYAKRTMNFTIGVCKKGKKKDRNERKMKPIDEYFPCAPASLVCCLYIFQLLFYTLQSKNLHFFNKCTANNFHSESFHLIVFESYFFFLNMIFM